jgi:SAM-dependent methyltransferase
VLDVATGHGEPALSAAERVGPAGHVVGLDLSPAMIDLARERARDVPNAEFVVGDMDRIDYPDASFDVLLCRFALMLSTDHVATFRELARVLAPGGVLATAVWGAHDTHLLAVGPTALGARLGMPAPPPGLPTTFSMSDPALLTAELTEAGFGDVSVEPFEIPYRFGSVAQYVRYIREILPEPMIRLVRDVFGDADAVEAWQVVARSVRPHTRPDGSVLLPSVCLCVRAVAGGV